MNLQERAKEVVVDNNGIAKSADFVAAGIRAVDVVNLCNAGFLNRVRHGYYQLAEQSVSSEEQLLATLIPKGIVCVESALFHYGYSDFAPRKWSIAVPRSMSRTKLKVDSHEIVDYEVPSDLLYLRDDLSKIIEDRPFEYDEEGRTTNIIKDLFVKYCKRFYSNDKIEYFDDYSLDEVLKKAKNRTEWDKKLASYKVAKDNFLALKVFENN